MSIIECVAGIDGGGTKTFIRVVDMENNVICEAHGNSTNLCSNSDDDVYNNLKVLFEQVNELVKAHIHYKAICLGTAGFSKENAENILSNMIKKITHCDNCVVIGDMEIPLEANAKDENAIVLISGTGSICYGKNKSGITARSGGWGHVIGDEGSGYWISCKILDAVMREHDGRGEKTLLTKLVLEHFKIESPTEIIQKIYQANMNKNQIAKLSVLIENAARNNDEIAISILNTAVEELFFLVKTVYDKLKIEKEKCKVIITGSVVNNNKYINEKLTTKLKDRYNDIEVIENDTNIYDPAWGAITIGKRVINGKY